MNLNGRVNGPGMDLNLSLTSSKKDYFFRFGWDMGSKMCRATGFLLTFLGIASIYNLTVIALFRYLVIEWSNVSYPKEMVKYNVLCLEDQFCET